MNPRRGGERAGRPFASLDLRERLSCRSAFLQRVRAFFLERDFIEVETPARVRSPGIDPYIDALPAGEDRYLATSPELEMKKLLGTGMKRIFQTTRAFRDGERGDLHNPEFVILEWYAAGQTYVDLMDDTEELVREAGTVFAERGVPSPLKGWPRPFPRITVDDAFRLHAGWVPSRSFRADPFFRDLVEKVEPALGAERAVFLTDYPERAGALARRKKEDPLLCERFELYLDGLEICNGFSELTDPEEQRARFERDNDQRRRQGREPYPLDEGFLAALEGGIPSCAGNALGVDRLLLALTGLTRLSEVTLLAGDGNLS